MNDKNILLEDSTEQRKDGQPSHRRAYGTVIAVVICLLLAAVVWTCVMNTQDTDYIPIRVISPEGYACELSVDGVEVKGTVAALRKIDVIELKVAADPLPGHVYDEADLNLPEGVRLVDGFCATLTVKEK